MEKPFRGHNFKLKRSQIFAFGGSAIGLIFLASACIYFTGGARSRVPKDVAEIDSANGDEYMAKEKMLQISGGTELRVIGNTDLAPTLLVWGDSHALASLPAVNRALVKLDRCAIVAEKGGTPPVINWGNESNPKTQIEYNHSVFEYAKAAKEKGLTDVLLVFYWSAYVEHQKTPNGFPEPPKGFADALIETIIELKRAGLNVIVLEETPVFRVHVAKAVALHKWLGTPLPILTYEESQAYRTPYNSIIKRILSSTPDTEIFDPQSLFLGEEHQFDFLDDDGHLLFKDQSHLTRRGSM